MGLIENLLFGFDVALSPVNLLYCTLGVTLGTLIGVLPGIGPMAAISMLLPLTFTLPPIAGLIMLAGIYYGAMYGGSTASILLNLPGTTAAAVLCLDGYPMAKQGRAGPAIVITTLASFFGGVCATMVLATFAPVLAEIALQFRAADYFAMMVVGLLIAATVAQGSALKACGMILFGILIGLVGTDVNTGVTRLNLGILALSDGIDLIVVAMGVFGIAEVLSRLESEMPVRSLVSRIAWRELVPTRADLAAAWKPSIRGMTIGSAMGILPGAGATLASFTSYSVEKQIARDPSRFGKGAIEGISAPEAANNAAAQTAFVPTLTLGIPGDAVMALMLGALMIHGIAPGPQLLNNNADLFWGLVASMLIGNLILLVLNLPLVGIWVRALSIPYRVLYPSVVVLICIGVFTIKYSSFDIMLVAVFGVLGYLFMKLGCEPAPLLLGLILGPMMEEYLRRALLLSRGDPSVFVDRPISAAFLVLAVAMIAWSSYRYFRESRQKRKG